MIKTIDLPECEHKKIVYLCPLCDENKHPDVIKDREKTKQKMQALGRKWGKEYYKQVFQAIMKVTEPDRNGKQT